MARGSSSTDDALVSLEWTTGAALAPYEACRQILAEALDVEPGLETVTLYESIRSGDLSRGAKAISPRHNLPGYDLLEMPDPGQFFGREDELSQLNQWLVADRCRLGPILDVGGVGKTSLAATFASSLLDQADSLTGSERPFSKIIWRSLLNAPILERYFASEHLIPVRPTDY